MSNKFTWYPEDMRFLTWHGRDVDPNDDEMQRHIHFWILLDQYEAHFGKNSVTTVCTDLDWLAEEMKKALETGIPVPKPDLPPGSVI